MCGRTRKDMIRNEFNRVAIGVAQIKDKMMQNLWTYTTRILRDSSK